MSRLAGKVAVITGAASGIGAASAKLFVAEGACVVIADIQDDRGQALAESLGPAATYCHADVTQEEDVRTAVARAVGQFGRLDCMFNNAGFGGVSDIIQDTDMAACRHTIDVLLTAIIMGMKHATPVMKAQGTGTIISTASVAGIGVGYGAHIYTACKAAVIHLTRSVANELGEDGIRVNCIAPGGIPTAIFGRAGGLNQEQAEAMVPLLAAGMARAQPIQRAGRPEDIAEAALWLASDASSFVTGHCLVVDGGLTTGKLWSQKMAELQQAAGGTPAPA